MSTPTNKQLTTSNLFHRIKKNTVDHLTHHNRSPLKELINNSLLSALGYYAFIKQKSDVILNDKGLEINLNVVIRHADISHLLRNNTNIYNELTANDVTTNIIDLALKCEELDAWAGNAIISGIENAISYNSRVRFELAFLPVDGDTHDKQLFNSFKRHDLHGRLAVDVEAFMEKMAYYRALHDIDRYYELKALNGVYRQNRLLSPSDILDNLIKNYLKMNLDNHQHLKSNVIYVSLDMLKQRDESSNSISTSSITSASATSLKLTWDRVDQFVRQWNLDTESELLFRTYLCVQNTLPRLEQHINNFIQSRDQFGYLHECHFDSYKYREIVKLFGVNAPSAHEELVHNEKNHVYHSNANLNKHAKFYYEFIKFIAQLNGLDFIDNTQVLTKKS